MVSKKMMMALGAASVALTPIAATAAAPVAAFAARTAPASADESALAGAANGGGLIIGLVALAALATAFVLIEDNDDSSPISP